MELQLGQNFHNVCKGCPALRAMQERVDQIYDPENNLTEEQQAEAMNLVALSAERLERAAGSISCHSIFKNLPPKSVPVPPTGDPRRIKFVDECPSYDLYTTLRDAPSN
jgi:hypothetical protein